MSVGHQTVPPIPSGQTPDASDALAFAGANDPGCQAIWAANCAGDNEAQLLLHYAYARALLANPQFQWDTCSRRGTIACRGGIVHAGKIDLTSVLD